MNKFETSFGAMILIGVVASLASAGLMIWLIIEIIGWLQRN